MLDWTATFDPVRTCAVNPLRHGDPCSIGAINLLYVVAKMSPPEVWERYEATRVHRTSRRRRSLASRGTGAATGADPGADWLAQLASARRVAFGIGRRFGSHRPEGRRGLPGRTALVR